MIDPAGSNRYRFGPLERRGVIAGWRGGQVFCVAASLLIAVMIMRVIPHSIGLVAACCVVGAGGFCATWPIGGMTVEQWAPVFGRWTSRGARRTASVAPRSGHRIGAGGEVVSIAPTLPRSLGGYTIVSAPVPAGGSMGVVVDERRGHYSALLAASSQGFTLLEATERDQRIASWSAVLAGFARDRSPVDRLQWVARSLSDRGEATAKHFEDGRHMEASSPPSRSYQELIEQESLSSLRSETFVVIRIDARRLGGRSSDGRRKLHGGSPFPARSPSVPASRHEFACGALLREVTTLASELRSAGVTVEGVLDEQSVEHVIAEAFRSGAIDVPDERPPGGPWPMGTRAEWGSFVTDDAHHAIYWIAEWPRTDVSADFLAPLLLHGSQRVTVSVTMEPINPLSATRRVENARVSRAADEELRRRGGFLSTARRRREDEAIGTREVELADGHAQYRFSGYVAVTAAGEEELEIACSSVEQAASRCFLSLRRLYGDQERAFTWVLPLGRGLS